MLRTKTVLATATAALVAAVGGSLGAAQADTTGPSGTTGATGTTTVSPATITVNGAGFVTGDQSASTSTFQANYLRPGRRSDRRQDEGHDARRTQVGRHARRGAEHHRAVKRQQLLRDPGCSLPPGPRRAPRRSRRSRRSTASTTRRFGPPRSPALPTTPTAPARSRPTSPSPTRCRRPEQPLAGRLRFDSRRPVAPAARC